MKVFFKSIFVFSFIIFNLNESYSQNRVQKSYFYAIEVYEYKKDWIDAEISYFLIETENLDFLIENDSTSFSILDIAYKWDIIPCCNNKYKNEELVFSDYFNLDEGLFNQKETFKLKFKDYTIKIIAIAPTYCKCNIKNIERYSNSISKKEIAILLNAKPLKLDKSIKRKMKKNKELIVSFLTKFKI